MPKLSAPCVLLIVALLTPGCQSEPAADAESPRADVPIVPSSEPATPLADADEPEADQADAGWETMFDGETLEGWSVTEFGGEGAVEVENGRIVLNFGNSLTGITWEDEDALPRTNYEIELDAMRVDGNDFFCGLTFPVNDNHCSLIVGGWGGTVVGLSTLDYFDASENDTTTLHSFDREQWYRIRVRVEPERIQAWIDDEQVVNANIADREVGIRIEVSRSRPLGIASFNTTAALRDIRIRPIND